MMKRVRYSEYMKTVFTLNIFINFCTKVRSIFIQILVLEFHKTFVDLMFFT